MASELLDLFDRNHLRVLTALRTHGPLRFSEIESHTGLNPNQVDRVLKSLREGFWIVPETIPAAQGRIPIHYRLGKRGEAALRILDRILETAEEERERLGDATVDTLESVVVR